MKFLIDTNIVIPLEPASTQDLEAGSQTAREFHQLVGKAGYQLFVHPFIKQDIERDKDKERAELRKKLIGKYSLLNNPPTIDQRPLPPLEVPDKDSNDWVDVNLLVALKADAVDYLITDDEDIHRKAARVGLQSRVLRLPDVVVSLKDLFDKVHEPPPAVEFIEAYGLNESDTIFESLRADYQGFDDWLKRCKSAHRDCFVIKDREKNKYIGLAILKREDDNPYGLTGKVLKLCTFKIAEEYSGYRYGELLLKAVFDYAMKNGYGTIFVTAFEKQKQLIGIFKSFGFYLVGQTAEIVLAKKFAYSRTDYSKNDPLAFHILFGPVATKFDGNNTFIVPILPAFHRLLFPEFETQSELFPGMHPCGNSIKKAYLSHSANNQIKPGDNLLFYRSADEKCVTAIGIVEGHMRSSVADDIARYVSTRTVYSYDQIQNMCKDKSRPKEVLAIKFRLVKILKPTISLDTLKNNGVVLEHPQSIQKIKDGSAEWIKEATQLQPVF